MGSKTLKPLQLHYIINLATFRSQNEPTDSADEAKIKADNEAMQREKALPLSGEKVSKKVSKETEE